MSATGSGASIRVYLHIYCIIRHQVMPQRAPGYHPFTPLKGMQRSTHLLSTGSTDQGQMSWALVRSASAPSHLPWRERALPAATAHDLGFFDTRRGQLHSSRHGLHHVREGLLELI